MWGHPDQVEGPAAFAEKREPQWAALTTDAPAPDE
jgi:enoyl-CoA hydratase